VPPLVCSEGLAFTDITSESPELALFPYGGEAGWDHSDKYGPGVGLADLDGDGALDLVLTRSERSQPELRGPVFFAGQGDGRFADGQALLWNSELNATAVVLFDYDSDDDLDIFVGVDGADSVLYRNDGARSFVDVSESVGLKGAATYVFAAAAGDVDGDGDLDLYLGQWRASLPEHGAGLADNVLLLNQAGVFAPSEQNVACDGRSTLGVALVDLDADADLDLYVANDFFDDCLYENDGAGAFKDVSAAAGIEKDAAHAMGVAVGDIDQDGSLDLLVTDTEQTDPSRGNALYLQDRGPLRFTSAAPAWGLDGVSTLQADWLVSWGVGIEDFDGDGLADVHVATHTEREEIFLHRGPAGFEPNWALINDLGISDSRGSAYGDIDGDGDLDIVVGRRNAPVQILRNDANARTLRVEVRPLASAAGAQVELQIGDTSQVRAIQAGSSYLSSSPPVATFGLCDHKRAETLRLRAPGRAAVVMSDIELAGAKEHVVIDLSP
jgi:hypothetical protein